MKISQYRNPSKSPKYHEICPKLIIFFISSYKLCIINCMDIRTCVVYFYVPIDHINGIYKRHKPEMKQLI